MTQNVSYHITYVEIFTMDRKLNILSRASQIFHESSFSYSVVMCGLSLQLSEYGAYDFANNASKVSITFLPPCLPPCHPLPPFSSSHSSSFSASFSTATVDHTNSDQSHSLLVFSTNHVAWYVLQVYTLDVCNSSAVRQAVYSIISRKNTQPFIPHKFTGNDTFTT